MTTSGSFARAETMRKPRDDEIDVYGLTHRGHVRAVNDDHFLIASLHRHVQIHLTSLPDAEAIGGETERLAYLAMVADGVGGGPHGDRASRWAVEAITRYVTQSLHCYYAADPTDEGTFPRALEEAALACHSELHERARQDEEFAGMATTLTLWIGVWPRAYLLQVGDSRAYLLRDGELKQL